MRPPAGGPPRWLERVVAFLTPDTCAGKAALGDLNEGWSRTRRERGALAANLRYLRGGLGLVRYRWNRDVQPACGIRADMALALRSLRRRPVLVIATLLTLVPALAAAGVGLTLGWTTLLRPLPHPASERLVVVEHRWEPFEGVGISTLLYDFYRTRARSLVSLGLVSKGSVSVAPPGGDARRVPVVHVTASALELLGARPSAGRLLTEDEDRAGAPPVVLLTHGFWTDVFGGDPSVLGRPLEVEGIDHMIVGVLEEGLEFPEDQPRLVLPTAASIDRSLLDMEWWYAIGRLASGSDAEASRRELEILLGRAVEEAPDGGTTAATLEANGIEPVVTPLLEWQTGRAREFILTLVGTVVLLLGLAVASSGTLLLGRAEERTPELRVRRALGAGGGRLFFHLVSDSVVLCLLAGALAAPIAWGATRALHAASSLELPRVDVAWLPIAAAAAALVLAVVLMPLFGLIPLRRGGTTVHAPSSDRIAGWSGLRGALLGTQVAVAAVLLTAMLALGTSVRALADAHLGYRPEGVVTFTISLPEASYPDDEVARAFHREVLAGVRDLPRVGSAGFGGGLPVPAAQWGGAMVEVEGHASAGDVDPTLNWTHVSEGFLETLGIPLLAGRPIEAQDREGPDVVVVNEALAVRYWGGADQAVGRRIRRGRSAEWSEVVGVVGNTSDDGPGSPPEPLVFAPERSAPPWDLRWNVFVARTSAAPDAVVPEIRELVRSADPAVPVFDVATMTERVRSTTARERLALRGVLFSGLASVVVVAASLGGLVLLSLLRRRREIGVRKAVGATDGRLRWLLIRGAVVPALGGLAAGAAAVLAGLRVPRSLLHDDVGIAALLGGTGALIALLVFATGALASLRVSSVEPSEALRSE